MFAPLTAKKRKQPITKVKEESSSSSEEEDQMEPESVELSDDEEEAEEEEEEEVEEEDSSEEEEEEEEEEVEEKEEDVQEGDDDEEEEEDEGSKRDTVRKLLEPFGKDQLLEFLKEAALTDRSIIDRISKAAESDPTHRKIFVHGLGWDSTSETVISVFKQYGQIEDCKVVMDKATGKCKGYGFVLFKNRDGASKALNQPQKKIGNRTASCQLASHGPVPMNNNNNQVVVDPTGRKIYVSNVGQHLSPEKLRAFFAQFGEIEEGPLGYDRMTGKLKGFAIFVYKTAEGCKKALEEPMKMFEGCKLQCSKALEGQRGGNKNQTVETSAGSVAAGVLQHNNNNNNALALNYAMGLNPGMVNPAMLMGHQHQGYGVYNPATWATLNHTGLSPSVASGVSPSVSRNATATSLGMGAGGVGAQSGINSISPSVIGSYGSQAALQGLGAYQNPQLGQSSSAPAATRSQAGVGSMGTFPSYYGR